LSVRLAPLLILLFASFLLDCIPSPVLAAPVGISLDQGDGGEDGDPHTPNYVGASRDCDPDDMDPYSLGLQDAYLNFCYFRGRAGASGPQIDDFGGPRGFDARGPPIRSM
jgi:hypothetical protein